MASIAAFEPRVQFTKPIGASLDLDAKVAASNRKDGIVARPVSA
jgi:hypothetical protein